MQDLFRFVVQRLSSENIQHAVCGGVAANLYRDELRLTADLDFLVDTKNVDLDYFVQIIKDAELTPYNLRHADLKKSPMMGEKSTPIFIIAGKDPKDKLNCGVDFLTLNNVWAESALARAQHQIVEFGQIKAPVITIEDLFIAKLFAILDSNRMEDLDDLEKLISAHRSLDLNYLSTQLTKHKLILPRDLESRSPDVIRIISKKNRTNRKS